MTTTALLDIGIPKKNVEGYPDLTCYRALKAIQRAEYGYRPLVYICSPYSGDVEANVVLTRRFSAFAVSARQIPLAPHLHYPRLMDETDSDARELAMFFNRILLSKCEQLWAYSGWASAGMRDEIDWTHQMYIPIRFFDADLQEVHLILVGALGQRYSHEARVAYASAPLSSRSTHTLNSCGDNSAWGRLWSM